MDESSGKATPRSPIRQGQTNHLARNEIKNPSKVTRQILFHPEVLEELREHYFWYEQKSSGLGERFLLVLELAYEIIQESPTVWPKTRNIFHKYQLNKFPFNVIYFVNEECITVYAVAHFSRKPFYWKQRPTEN